jgi:hypothetical protein
MRVGATRTEFSTTSVTISLTPGTGIKAIAHGVRTGKLTEGHSRRVRGDGTLDRTAARKQADDTGRTRLT